MYFASSLTSVVALSNAKIQFCYFGEFTYLIILGWYNVPVKIKQSTLGDVKKNDQYYTTIRNILKIVFWLTSTSMLYDPRE